MWAEAGEKNTRYFLRLENRHAVKKAISRLVNDQNQTITDQKEILKEISDFYRNLYMQPLRKFDKQAMIDELKKIDLPLVDGAQKTNCDRAISENECLIITLRSFSKNKYPGLDGLTPEFYLCFWDEIKPIFIRALNLLWKEGVLTNSQRQGIITVLPKPNKDHLKITNYCPITLQNVDYKIISKVINTRMRKTLSQLIHPDQNGFQKNRNISNNIRLTFDVIDYVNHRNIPGAILSLDIQKAFDSIDWLFVKGKLERCQFGVNLIKCVEILYTRPECYAINNGYISDIIKVKRGVRQGDPLSFTLFVLAIEWLAESLRQGSYQGIKVKDKEIKESLFADDTLVFLEGTKNDFDIVFDILHKFGELSGCKINGSKSKAFYIGNFWDSSNKYRENKGLTWPVDIVTYLGITIPVGKEKKNIFELNFANTVNKIRSILNVWSSRSLSLLDKITIIKSLVIPILIYKVSLVPCEIPKKFIQEVNKTIFQFIWGSKWERVARSKLCNDIKNGGANTIDIEPYIIALRLNWMIKFLDDACNSSWKEIERFFSLVDVTLALRPSRSIHEQNARICSITKYAGFYRRFAKIHENLLWRRMV